MEQRDRRTDPNEQAAGRPEMHGDCLWDDRRALTLETSVRITDGPDGAVDSVRLFRTMQKRPEGALVWYGEELDEAAFRQRMLDEQ
jgi:hypothetical protein